MSVYEIKIQNSGANRMLVIVDMSIRFLYLKRERFKRLFDHETVANTFECDDLHGILVF